MQIFTNPQELAAQCKAWHRAGDDIALVPTMGYYHQGHEDLMAFARTQAKRLVVSLFVNPTQFGPGEDLEAYPRNAERDADIARSHGADALFMPQPETMYATDHATWVEVPELSRGLCGLTRPVHFRGVCTVVLKLFMLTGADVAVFGQKDWQQQAILAPAWCATLMCLCALKRAKPCAKLTAWPFPRATSTSARTNAPMLRKSARPCSSLKTGPERRNQRQAAARGCAAPLGGIFAHGAP